MVPNELSIRLGMGGAIILLLTPSWTAQEQRCLRLIHKRSEAVGLSTFLLNCTVAATPSAGF